jgi:hypothetical protein
MHAFRDGVSVSAWMIVLLAVSFTMWGVFLLVVASFGNLLRLLM